MEKFTKLGLSKEVTDVLKAEGFETPTEIQEKAIPLALAGKDIIGGSATGSGKTLAFAAPILENLKSNGNVQALILTPTRELAEQVAKEIRKFSKNKDLNTLPVYGGVNMNEQVKRLSVTDVVVGTPGRILDHMQKRTLNLNGVKVLVLDEVDRMFDMGFHQDVERIIGECPEKRQTMMFSATVSQDIDYLAQKYTNNAVEIAVESYVDTSKLKQIYYDVESGKKFSLLVHLLRQEKSDLVMVFCSTRRNADFIASNLNRMKIHAKAIHGGLDQKKRLRILKEFQGVDGIGVLVCTDVAARGLDIKGVSHVYNYDLPKTSDDYIHRVGRTARAGENGIAISLLASRDYENFGIITRDESLKITPVEVPNIERVAFTMDFKDNRGGRGQMGGRGTRRDSGRGDRPYRAGGRGAGGGSPFARRGKPDSRERQNRRQESRRGARDNRSQDNRDNQRGFGGGGESRRPSMGDGRRDNRSSSNFSRGGRDSRNRDRKRPDNRRPSSSNRNRNAPRNFKKHRGPSGSGRKRERK